MRDPRSQGDARTPKEAGSAQKKGGKTKGKTTPSGTGGLLGSAFHQAAQRRVAGDAWKGGNLTAATPAPPAASRRCDLTA